MQSTSLNPSLRSGDGALKKRQIAEHLRARIVGGELLPGARLPTRVELEQQFGVSTVTVQGALDFLVANEFVRVNGRRGTFVVENPPHLSRYALVIREHPVSEPQIWTRFETALCDEAARLERSTPVRIQTFLGAEAHPDVEAFGKVVGEVREHRLAGLIFLNPRYYFDTPLFTIPGIARVGVGVGMSGFEGGKAINLDMGSFWDRAFDWVAEQGKRKVAVLTSGQLNEEKLLERAHKRGLEVRPEWIQFASATPSQAASQTVRLLLSGKERPDAIVISDDNLLESATQGVLNSGVERRAVEIVSHCNFPYPAPALVPVKRLGFDIRAVLQECLQNIHAQQRGEAVADVTNISAIFDDELSAS